MNFLLDTHVFIWAFSDRGKLSRTAKDILEDRENMVYVSAVTFWEISLKFPTGKLTWIGAEPQDLPGVALLTGFKIISLTYQETSTYHQLEATWHKDPFDRMLIWQAIQQDLILVSKDDQIKKYSSIGLKTLW